MSRATLVAVASIVAALAVTSLARADSVLRIGVYSENVSSDEAAAGARIQVRARAPGRPPTVHIGASAPDEGSRGASSSAEPPPPVYATIRSDSPLLRNPEPLGPGSFWYADDGGHVCPYLADSVPPCFTVVTPGAGAAPRAGFDPAAVAASLAARLSLEPGAVRASPADAGLTGAASWFWLDPAPTRTSLTLALAGEQVTVSAEPEVEWRFGDGAVGAGAGVPYRAGPPPAEAVTHVYGTRCLPGDRGRNPYVLPGCDSDGYRVEAIVRWRVSYGASGPLDSEGGLPSRTTVSSAAYAVTEARGFLVDGGSR